MRVPIGAAAIALLTCAGVGHAHAQTAAARVGISVNAGVQPSPISFSTSTTRPVHLESSVVDTAYEVRNGLLVDRRRPLQDRGRLRRRRRGVLVLDEERRRRQRDGSAPVLLPHAAVDRRHRDRPPARGDRHSSAGDLCDPAEQTAGGHDRGRAVILQGEAGVRRERVVHRRLPVRRARVHRRLVDASTGNKTGFNAGADVGIRLSSHAGVGALVRFSRARIPFVVPDGTTVTSDAGGIQVAGGLRLYF